MDSEKIRSFLDRLPIGLLTLVCLGFLGWDAYDFLKSPDSSLGLLSVELQGMRSEKDKYQLKLAAMKEFQEKLELRKQQIRDQVAQLSNIKTIFSDEVHLANVMKLMFTEAKRAGVSVLSLSPSGEEKAEYYASSLFKMTIKGVFSQLVEFMDRLSSTEQILRADQLSMKTTGIVSKKHAQIESVIEVRTFRYVRSQADSLDGEVHAEKPSEAKP